MTPQEVIRLMLGQDLGSDQYRKDGAPRATFAVYAKSQGVLCGMIYIPTILRVVSEEFFLDPLGNDAAPQLFVNKRDGQQVRPGDVLCEIEGNAEVLLKAERTILYFLTELSGIATATQNAYLAMGFDSPVKILDTRKDNPLMRAFHKYAVGIGGGKKHRFGFFDGILVKDNDIAVYGGIRQALDVRCREQKHLTKVEVEVGNLKELEETLADSRVNGIMLDNMAPDMLRAAVAMIKNSIGDSARRYDIEASGVGKHPLKEVAETGVQYISLSAIVCRPAPMDFSMKVLADRVT